MEKLQNQMTTKEQKQALIYFNEWIKKGNATTKHANPTQENCYISSGDIWGLYFPNTQIILNNANKHHYNFLCVAKNNYNVLGVVYSLKMNFTIMASLKDYYKIIYLKLLILCMIQ